jgi:hypothetical protein
MDLLEGNNDYGNLLLLPVLSPPQWDTANGISRTVEGLERVLTEFKQRRESSSKTTLETTYGEANLVWG